MALQRILIVDGETARAGELAERLTALGYEVAALAGSLDEAEGALASAAPDVALVCAEMADAGGPAALLPSLPVVMLEPETAPGRGRPDGAVPGAPPSAPVRLPPAFTDRELALTLELARSRHHVAMATHELEWFFEQSIDLFCFLDFEGRFRRLNPAWERTLGLTRGQLTSRPFIEFVHPDDRERTLKQNAAVRAGGQAILFENRYLCSDGSYRWFLWNATAFPDERVIYGAARDITERKKAEAERVRLVEELHAVAREVRSLQKILPICSYCRKVRDDDDYWHEVEVYVSRHTDSRFSHSICPDCMEREVEPQLGE